MTARSAPAVSDSKFFSLPVVAAVIAVTAACKLFLAGAIELAFDEGYYTFWSFYPQVGYLDHPPAVAWMIAAGRMLFGDTELGARLFAVLSGAAIAAMLYRIGAVLFDRRTGALAAILYSLTLAAGLGFIITPDPPSALFWAAVLWAVAEFIDRHDPVWLLIGGVFAGLGLWSKYTNAFLLIGLLLFILVSSERRRWFTLWQLWAAPIVALIVFAPVIWWNAERGWASFFFQGRRTSVSGFDPAFPANLGELLAGQAIFMVPVLFVFTGIGLVHFLRRPADPARSGFALPVLTSLPALAYFLFHTLHGRVEANWLLPLWSGLTLVGAATMLRLRPAAGKWLKAWRVALGAQIVLGVVMIGLVWAQFLVQPLRGPDFFDRTQETRGWRPLASDLAQLAESHGAHWMMGETNYPSSGEIATYLRFSGSSLPYYPLIETERYEFLPPIDPGALGWPALLVRPAATASGLAQWFGKVDYLEMVTRRSGAETMESYDVYLVSEPTDAFLNAIAGEAD